MKFVVALIVFITFLVMLVQCETPSAPVDPDASDSMSGPGNH